ncbi:hypothetical protein EAF00_009817 [Botryotinia globosa]|nr:hypothetical protein EAF00_009817 [Botryotinia globosa]
MLKSPSSNGGSSSVINFWAGDDSASEYTNTSSSRTQPIGSRHAVIRSFHNLLQIRGAIPLLIAGFFATLSQRVQILILQYMPEQFNISFSEANKFIVLDHVANLLVLFIDLPLMLKNLSL